MPEAAPVAAASDAPAKPATLDDLMIAMDVVDTMRHREDLVARELNEVGREAELIGRLKQIYREQGIDVPDHVLAEGVKALKESRFTYAPPPPSLKRRLFEIWVQRWRFGTWAGLALVLLLGSCGYQHFVTRPAQLAEERARIEITESLPQAIRQAHSDLLAAFPGDDDARRRAEAWLTSGERAIQEKDRAGMRRAVAALKELREEIAREHVTLPTIIRQENADILAAAPGDDESKRRAAALLADGERAIRDKDRAGMKKSADALKALREEIVREYTLTIVSRPGETSGVWRRPPGGAQARNYYLIVEAIAPGGAKLTLPIRNEENGRIDLVDKFGVRVPQSTFDAVAADKRDDGIIQKNRYGTKKRGTLTIEYQMPYEGGMITRW